MINPIEKFAFGGIVAFHIFCLVILLTANEVAIFGIRSFNEKVLLYTGVEITLFIMSFVFIYKNSRLAYVILVTALVSSYIIFFGHRLGIYECPYCQL